MKTPMITKEQAMTYEAGRCNLFMSFFYLLFPKYFQWRCEIRYDSYLYFIINRPK
jgi:hypothetical protein